MPESVTFLLGYPVNTYTYFVTLGLCGACALLILFHRGRAHAAFDAFLAALAGALVVGRTLYVALDWAYFAAHPDAIVRLTDGGLSWHGALWGALIAAYAMSRVRDLCFARVTDAGALVLPLIAYAVAWGCAAARCGYGAEVASLADYAAWLVWEQPDIYGLSAPRFATQALGAWLAVSLLALSTALTVRGWLAGRRLGLVVILLSAGMLVIDGLRGDIPATTRGTLQVFDFLCVGLGTLLFIMSLNKNVKRG